MTPDIKSKYVIFKMQPSIGDCIWQIRNPMIVYLSYFVMQLIANSITRIVKLILKPLQKPHFTSKVLISPK
ncbi:hypothetical protein AB3S75_041784 [Citrus x aurantiifolia]